MLTDALAGAVCGLVVGTAFLGAGIYVLFTRRDIYDRLAGALPPPLTPTVVMLGYVIGVPAVWTMIGLIAGVLYNVASEARPDSGLGSANFAFTLGVLALAALVGLILLVFRRRLFSVGLMLDLAFLGIFGWILPLLANWR